jgi:hypothetical protein
MYQLTDHFSSYAGSQIDEATTLAIVIIVQNVKTSPFCCSYSYIASCQLMLFSQLPWLRPLVCHVGHMVRLVSDSSCSIVIKHDLSLPEHVTGAVTFWIEFGICLVRISVGVNGYRNWCYHVLPRSLQEWQDSSSKQTKPSSFKSVTTQKQSWINKQFVSFGAVLASAVETAPLK